MALPKVAIIPTGGTIQNGQPLVTSTKAGGGFDVLRAQRLHDPVTVNITNADIDGNPLIDPSYRAVELRPEDGLYLLPYMEPGHEPSKEYSSAHMAVERVVEEVNRFGVDTNGRNGLLAETADLVVIHPIDPETGVELRAGGETFTMGELALISNTVNKALKNEDVVAAVVTHGTFTSEETAYFLNLTVNSDKPVIVSASQRRHRSIGNDGDWNLVDAIRVAVSADAPGKGVMLVMDEQIFPAREVTKTNQRPGGFMSSGGSALALGSVESDQVSFYFASTRRHTSRSGVLPDGEFTGDLPRVDVVKTYAGADSVQIDALIGVTSADGACQGMVVEGFAYSGAPHRFQRPALERAVAEHGIPVALASRGDHGRVPRTQGDLFITCDNLMAIKARLLLTMAIRRLGPLSPYRKYDEPTPDEIDRLQSQIGEYQRLFDTH
jgi:L-asparaginase